MSIKHLTFDDSGTLLAANINISPAVTVLTLTDDTDILFLFNDTEQPVTFNVPSGPVVASGPTTKNIRLPKSSSIAIDCRTNSKRIPKGIITVKYSVSSASTGEVTVIAAR